MTRIIGVGRLSVLFVLFLAGCSNLQQTGNYESVPVVDRGSDLNGHLEELHASREMSPEELNNILAAREQDFLDNPSYDNRMRLVLLLAAGDKAIQDKSRALELLEGIDTIPLSAGEQEMMIILRQFLEEQVEASGKLASLARQRTEQNQRIEELEQQLRQLTTIEQSIQQRDKSLETGDGQ